MKSKIGVLIPRTAQKKLFSEEDRSRLNALGEVSWNESDQKLVLEEAIAFLADCEIGVGSWGTISPCDEVMSACPKLKLWEHVAGSVKAMFGSHLDGRELTIASCAPAIAPSVAEMVVGQLITGLRRIPENAKAIKKGPFRKPENLKRLFESKIGIIGASLVGKSVIHFLKPFEPQILIYDPFLSEAEANRLGVIKKDNLQELCSLSDAVTLHTPDLPATRHLIGKEELQAMKDDTVFINTSQGICVDQDALVEELQKGRLTVFLDVSAPEPLPEGHPIYQLPNVTYTAHIAGGANQRLGRQAVKDIEAYLEGRSPQMVVTPEMLEQVA